MTAEQDIHFMRLALDQARKGQATPGGAEVGAVLVKNGEIVCAETTSLEGCTLYCTLQPCGMCTMACLWAGISRVVYGAGRREVHAVYFESRHHNTTDFIRDAFRSDLDIVGGVLAAECAELYVKPQERVDPDPAHKRTSPVY